VLCRNSGTLQRDLLYICCCTTLLTLLLAHCWHPAGTLQAPSSNLMEKWNIVCSGCFGSFGHLFRSIHRDFVRSS
jgi:hypothetical protein